MSHVAPLINIRVYVTGSVEASVPKVCVCVCIYVYISIYIYI